MRVFAALALVPALVLAAPDTAQACGPGGGGEADFIPEEDSASLILARARQLEARALDNDREARDADRRARTLLAKARGLQQRAVLREGVELAEMLQNARSFALSAAEAKAHAGRARQRAVNLRAQARALRRQAVDFAGFEQPQPRRRRAAAFAL